MYQKGGVVIFRDITREEEMRLKLKESNKLKDLFIDIMRHDLLNPIGNVRLTAQTGLLDEKNPKKKETLERIERSSNRAVKLIQNATTFAKLESGEKIEFKEEDIAKMLKQVVQELEARAKGRGMKIKMKGEDKLPVTVNSLIGDVFSNFITNAIKYGQEKTDIIIDIKKAGNNCRVSIANKGQKIPDKYKKAVFDRFTRLEKGAIQGTGLGLAIVKKIVEVHNGKVWVEDNPGGGSIFIVEFPRERKSDNNKR